MRKTTKLKNLYRRKDKILICISSPTPYGAKLIEAAGYEYTYAAGGVTGSSMLAMPDNGTIGLTEFVWMAKLIGDAVAIPVACDVDTCFGGIFHVQRAVSELIRAGLAGIRIEDQPFIGKRFGGMAGKEVIPLDEAVAKLRMAVDTRDVLDPDFQIVARCEALTASNGGGVPDAIERLKAYRAAGADVLHLEGPGNVEEIRAVRAEVEGPLTANFYNLPNEIGPDEAFGLGLTEARYPRLLSNAMNLAGAEVLRRFREEGIGGVTDYHKQVAPFGPEDLPDVARLASLRATEEKYLPANMLEKYGKA